MLCFVSAKKPESNGIANQLFLGQCLSLRMCASRRPPLHNEDRTAAKAFDPLCKKEAQNTPVHVILPTMLAPSRAHIAPDFLRQCLPSPAAPSKAPVSFLICMSFSSLSNSYNCAQLPIPLKQHCLLFSLLSIHCVKLSIRNDASSFLHH